jgi:putative intracellular protease/amidase
VGRVLERFWSAGKVVGAICHGAISLGNIPDRVRGLHVTGYSLEADRQLEAFFGPAFLLPRYPQAVLEESGTQYSSQGPADPWVVSDGRLVTGQNQQSASEYALVLYHALLGSVPISHH